MKCYFCKKEDADSHVDYCTATGRKTLPGLGSRSFDARYGYPCHKECLDKKLKKQKKKLRPAE